MFEWIITNNLPQIITAVIAIAVVWKYLSKILPILKEVCDLLHVVVIAFEDKKLTKEEFDNIIKEAKEIPAAIKDALKK